jgi:VWFA-related protein
MKSGHAFAALATVAAVCCPAAAQQLFRSGVDVVRVDTLVTDGRRPLAGLKARDFEIRDNGKLQAIDSVVVEQVPLSITLVLDTSASVAGGKMTHLAAAADAVLTRLRASDRAALVTFSHRVWLRAPLTSRLEQIRAVLATIQAQGGTSLYDAVYAGLALSDTRDFRPLVMVFSDGLDNASWLGGDLVERAAQRADAVVYGVAVGAREIREFRDGRLVRVRHEYLPGQTVFLDTIASATGGRVVEAESMDNLPKAFGVILQEFRTRYLITYSPRGVDTPGWHTIDVKVKARRAEVRARRGYQK